MNPAAPTLALSERAARLRPSSTLAVSARVKELKAQGADIIGFGAGEPDFDTPANIKQAAIDALLAGTTGYAPTPGVPEARRVIAEKLQNENSIDCRPEHIIITNGAKQALFMSLQVLINPGDEVVLPTPSWVSYRPMIELAGGEVVEVAGAVENAFRITPAQLAGALTPRTRAFLINSPSNPCGTMYSEDELREFAEILGPREDIFILTDEIYEKLLFGGVEHFSLGSIPEIAERVVTINGLSKAYAMTGWRIGYLCAPGFDGGLIKRLSMLQDQMTSCITSFTYPAVIEALTNSAAAVEEMRTAFARRAALMFDEVRSIPGFECPRPTGAFYVFPRVSDHFGKTSSQGASIDSAVSFAAALLDEAGVAVVPGDDFGECARDHIRLSFACSDHEITEGMGRMREWVGFGLA